MATWDELVALASSHDHRPRRKTADPACARKKVFRTRDEATFAIRAMRRRRGFDVTSYQCPSCHLWHITSRR